MLKDELTDRYGSTMTVPDLAEVFHVTSGSIYNKISKETFEVPTVKLGGRVVALTSDVIDYINNERLRANHG